MSFLLLKPESERRNILIGIIAYPILYAVCYSLFGQVAGLLAIIPSSLLGWTDRKYVVGAIGGVISVLCTTFMRFFLSDGSYHPFDMNEIFAYAVIIFMGIAASHYQGIQMTLLEQRHEVQSQKQYFETLITSSPVAIIVLDENNLISAANPAFCKLFEFSEDEIRGESIDDLIVPIIELDMALDMTRLACEGERVHHIGKRKTKSGRFVDVDIYGVPVLIEGKQSGALALYHDITELVKTENELRDAKMAAEQAAQTKAEFLSNMSHEIRTPLNAIVGMSSLLMDTPLDHNQADYVATIRSSTDDLLNIVNNILDFSKIEAGKMVLEEQPFYLSELIESSLDLFTPDASVKGLDLAYVIEDFVPAKIIGDPTRLRQILVNLLANAVKFTEKGEVVVQLSSKRLEGEIFSIQFRVRDTGIGIPIEKRKRLFQPFSQIDASTTRKYGGTGLGLSISKNLVELMGGEIWVNSDVGRGSTFNFTIIAQASPTTDRLVPIVEQPDMSGIRLLIVDDNQTNRLIVQRFTEKWGMIPTAVESGPQALSLLEEGQGFDLAIIDMLMPEMDGTALAAKIHERKSSKDLQLIMLSSAAVHRDAPEYLQHFSAFIQKPIKRSNLFDVIMTVIDNEPITPQKKVVSSDFGFDSGMAKNHPLKILLAEDNIVNQKVAVKLLEKFGYRVDIAGNGLEVIQAFERQNYDVIFMDIQMPEMDGEEAMRVIKRGARSQPWIVAMTAHALDGDREKYLSRGMDDYISKPLNVKELIRILERIPPKRKKGK
jgi:PAS domain S-box-containing protein